MMKCLNCGNEVNDSHLFCLHCGTKLEKAAQPEAEAFAPSPEQPMEAAPAPEVSDPEPVAVPQPEQQAFRDPFGPSAGEVKDQQQASPGMGAAYAAPAAAPAPEDRPPVRPFFEDNLAPIVKTGNWFGTTALWAGLPALIMLAGTFCAALLPGDAAMIVPIVALVFAILYLLVFPFVMAFNKRVNPNKQNFFRAYLLWLLILIILYIVLFVVLIFVGIEMFDVYGTELMYNLPYTL